MNQNKIYVGNLSFSTTEKDLEELFGKYGKITEFNLINDRDTGRFRGFGFITFAEQQAAEKSLELNNKEVGGRAIKVSIAKENTGKGGSRGGARSGARGGYSRDY